MPISTRTVAAAVLLAVLGAGCATSETTTIPTSTPTSVPGAQSTSSSPGSSTGDEQRFPDVVEAELDRTGDTWRVTATISSPYDGPDRYADAFRVLAPDSTVLGVRELLHDHANEQPFTRSLDDVEIPDEVEEVVVEGRDLANGWGGGTVTIAVPS